MVGAQWKMEEYVIGYKPTSKEKNDIGFNYLVGNKWPLKGWPMEYWKKLEKQIGPKYSVSWQRGRDNMEEYFEWIKSCRVLVTNDSFGMHIAIALKKKFVAIFGPTHCQENCLYDRGVAFYPKDFSCDLFPCRVDKCAHFKNGCTTTTSPAMIYEAVEGMLMPVQLSERKRRKDGHN